MLDLLAILRADFLAQLTHHCFDLEHLVIALSSGRNIKADFDALFRLVHNLKGAGGTHGVNAVTAICHLFEDNLASVSKTNTFDTLFVDSSLELIDLLRRVALDANQSYENIANELDHIRLKLRQNQKTVFVMESSKVMRMLFENTFSSLNVKLIFIDDGIQALSRLLHEPVEIIISANSLMSLNGMAVLSALKVQGATNAHTPVLFYCSNPAQYADVHAGIKIVCKTPDLALQLASDISRLIGRSI